MSQKPKDYESTVMRMAGNIVGHLINRTQLHDGYNGRDVKLAVAIARAIVAEVKRTEPAPADPQAETSAP